MLREMWEEVLMPVLIILAIIAVFVSVVAVACNHLLWFSKSAQIEQLRADASLVDAKMAEDVAGQVAVVNQEIAATQRWRRTMFRFFLPSGWDEVKLIDMPKVEE